MVSGEYSWEEREDGDFDIFCIVIWSGSISGEGGKMRDGFLCWRI